MVHDRDVYFEKSEQCYHWTSTDAEAFAVRLLLQLHRKRHIPVIFHCMLLRMLMIQVIAQSFCLILAKATHTNKIQLSPFRDKDEEQRKRL